MATAPAADQQRLLAVQDLDLQAQQAQHRRSHLPVLATITSLEDDAMNLDEKAVLAKVAAGDLKREVQKAEDDVQTVRARAERDNARLNSGQGLSKDLVALQHELEVLAKRQSDLEDIEIEVMERLEEAEKEHVTASAELADVNAKLADAVAARDEEQGEIDTEIAMIIKAREGIVGPLDADLVKLYEQLRERNGGIGAAAFEAGSCGGCHMNLTSSDIKKILDATPEQVLRCEECGRILVRVAKGDVAKQDA